ncbi:cell filamentation protein Fic [Campylobacter coli]|uniref:Fic/DOC family protein n=1 Tax=Campylobacter coli TaxID=195 RepID=UPI0007080F49|nr:Fic family protein [Campylobacter coli]EAH5118086.1 cell filamentation protein Fic [Campylobacter coli]EAJ2721973.1 cell filamentation protein Fic [Campylobacter coli]EAJ3098533.1 cell filamentation protein Fic [Campylobacter coli]EAK7307360.1 cell filamentation protein Fic [Campylobacter coli]EAK7389684.1 cell filamentation protein Fic [Campylobacter coli]
MWDSQENLSEFDKFLIKTNKIGAKSLDELFRKERMITNKKALELGKNPIKGNFDYQHLKDIHKALFEDVYTWAGQDRMQMGLKEKFAKYAPNGAIINFVPGKELDKYSKIIFDELAKNNYLKNSKDLNHFAKNLAKFMGEINALHPFREGNGRTQRIFLNELAKNAGYKLDLNLIPKDKMIMASVEASQLKLGKLEAIIKTNLKSFRQNLDLEQNKGISL